MSISYGFWRNNFERHMYVQTFRCFFRIADARTVVKTDCLSFLYRFRSANISVVFDVMI